LVSLNFLMRTILIVDDSPTIRRMIRASLGILPDTKLTEAASGLQAIEALAVSPVHMVLLDLNMPDMHGLDVLRFVRSHDHYKDVPVMVLTTRGDSTSRDAALQAGASAYMTKPFSPSVLAASVAELLALARSQSADA
jgi:two-component system chemotaxis response regulator CheY